MRYNVYKRFVAPLLFIICMEILLCSVGVVSVARSMDNNTTIEVTLNNKINSTQFFGQFIFRARLFGPIYNLSIDGDDYEFESENYRELVIMRRWEPWFIDIEYLHTREHITVGFYGFKFRGIIKPNFICGCFY